MSDILISILNEMLAATKPMKGLLCYDGPSLVDKETTFFVNVWAFRTKEMAEQFSEEHKPDDSSVNVTVVDTIVPMAGLVHPWLVLHTRGLVKELLFFAVGPTKEKILEDCEDHFFDHQVEEEWLGWISLSD